MEFPQDQPEFCRYVLTFTKTQDTLDTFADVKTVFPDAVIIPVPYAVGDSCGLAIELPRWQPEKQYAYFKSLSVPASLHRLTMRKDARGVNRVLKADVVL